jgi:hypothetical protein
MMQFGIGVETKATSSSKTGASCARPKSLSCHAPERWVILRRRRRAAEPMGPQPAFQHLQWRWMRRRCPRSVQVDHSAQGSPRPDGWSTEILVGWFGGVLLLVWREDHALATIPPLTSGAAWRRCHACSGTLVILT